MLVQEPWYNKIGIARKDNTQQGVDILGGVASPAWEIHYPGLTEGQYPKVMAYSHKPTQSDNTCLQELLEINIDAVIPTLIIGDFNMHA